MKKEGITALNSWKYRLRWWTLVVLSLTLVLVSLDEMILNVALPTLQRELGASASGLQWMVNSYMLAFGGLLLMMGGLGDRFCLTRGCTLFFSFTYSGAMGRRCNRGICSSSNGTTMEGSVK